jgi:site-specific DNA-methyltransferase (adenine-specific)
MLNNFHNPDVLTCISNLSNDRVFTPPSTANKMLDTLPKNIWEDENITFLDPFTKSGVFLREITKRLIEGLESKIPDLEKRIDHILRNQVFGISIDELTALTTRRSLYCSKKANGKYSIVDFQNQDGNIFYKESNHYWLNGVNCRWCGISKAMYNRTDEAEKYAYSFIHTDDPKEFFNMKFDVIVGNPPYQLNDGGGKGSSAVPIYHKFVETAIQLNPRYLTMIIQSRYFSGGRGLDKFRKQMLNDTRIKEIHDFPNSKDCFPSQVEIKGGVNYFLWERDYSGDCLVTTHSGGEVISSMKRPLLEKNSEVFIRNNEAISIIKKIQKFNEDTFDTLVSSNDPFGFDRREENSYKRKVVDFKIKKFNNSIELYYNGWKKNGIGYVKKSDILKNKELINGYKLYIPKAWGNGDLKNDILKPISVKDNSCCTETYLMIGPYDDVSLIENIQSYMETDFFHLLVLLLKNTQNAMKKVYSLVPLQDFSKKWNDEMLFTKYKLTKNEILFIKNLRS